MGNQATNADKVNYYKPGNLAWYYRRDFKVGRTTAETCPSDEFLMPNPELGCDGLKSIFIDHVYKASSTPWILTAAISGAHTLGSAKLANSGYNGFWSNAENAHLFNNDYYISMVAKGWGPELAVGGNKGKTQWKRIDKGTNPKQKEQMLNTDMCLVWENNKALVDCIATGANGNTCNVHNDKGIPLLAKVEDCCSWITSSTHFNSGGFSIFKDNELCGITSNSNFPG